MKHLNDLEILAKMEEMEWLDSGETEKVHGPETDFDLMKSEAEKWETEKEHRKVLRGLPKASQVPPHAKVGLEEVYTERPTQEDWDELQRWYEETIENVFIMAFGKIPEHLQ